MEMGQVLPRDESQMGPSIEHLCQELECKAVCPISDFICIELSQSLRQDRNKTPSLGEVELRVFPNCILPLF